MSQNHPNHLQNTSTFCYNGVIVVEGVIAISALANLSDEDLMEVYEKALNLQLETAFIGLLAIEMDIRGLREVMA
ncbi:sporulation histidine kinase inhibitor Sda [Bacillus sp. T33-2]|uniref:sporulation histidine kinase inhibitor Sda n=1 Tax=Bacillus sp. T33-2 TaxID=2054168 RepID=UPI000C77E6A1|nr:sporulation histidine kinase inhibitor Sda [Bacillus sp. T33-2]PLR90801.1 hypothetical protein CVD19_22480 [Bacillus sp. T33-2]